MKTSRQQILEYVQAQRVVTAGDLGRALHMTAANARHHLGVLQEQGLIDVVGQRPARGKGRPALLYAPSERTLGDNLDLLSGALLDESGQRMEVVGRSSYLRRVAWRLAAQIGTQPGDCPQDIRTGSLTQRLYQVVQSLERCHYQARWEAHAQGPRVILGRCPYAAILEQHPELCRIDAYMLEELLGERLEQTARLERDARGMRYCTFRVLGGAVGGAIDGTVGAEN